MQNLHNFVQVTQGEHTTVFEITVNNSLEPPKCAGLAEGARGVPHLFGKNHEMITIATVMFEDVFPDVEVVPELMEWVSFPVNGRYLRDVL